ncbi:MAG TPA: TIGR03618 family F420-dependent PPOX class oxidoreductase [Candidatus Limnocylindria bacterium]|nr:TIGR03618 family F420-dependent PPOX class oxidoreductase [Candidatus Limnocylindria bacterium]
MIKGLSAAAHDLLSSAAVASLVTLNADGSPHVSSAWVGVEDTEIVIATLDDQRKLRNMRRDPRVALTLHADRTNRWGLREYLVVYGTARITEGGAAEILQRLAWTYIGPGVVFPGRPDPPPGFITRIRVERVAGVGQWRE